MQQQENTNTLQRYRHYKTLLMTPKDRDNKLQESVIIYKFKCPHINWGVHWRVWENIWGQAQGTSQGSYPIHQHSNSTGHPVSLDYFNIVHRESQGISRNMKEVMYIWVNDPFLTGTWGNTNYHTSGTRLCKTLWHFNLNKPSPSLHPHTWSTTPYLLTIVGGTYIF